VSKKKPKCPTAAPDAGTPTKSPTAPCNKPNPEVIRRGNITITVDREKKTITMDGNQEFYGTGADQAYCDRATKEINDTWSGATKFEGQDYTVKSNIKGKVRKESDSETPGANQIHVVKTSDPASVTRQKDPANQSLYAKGPGYQHSTEDDDGGLTIAHEFGHSMGLKDEYTEGPRNPDGTRSIVRTGPAGGLMGYIDKGSRPTADNFNSLITGCGLAD
jgi:hypothetical protein